MGVGEGEEPDLLDSTEIRGARLPSPSRLTPVRHLQGRPLSGGHITNCIFGIGLNVNQTVFDPSLTNPTSLAIVTGGEYDLRLELEKFTSILASSFSRVLLNNDTGIDKEYESRLYRKGESHEYVSCRDGKVFEGVIVGVSPEGKLRVHDKKGEHKEFAFKEINYII